MACYYANALCMACCACERAKAASLPTLAEGCGASLRGRAGQPLAKGPARQAAPLLCPSKR